MMFSSADASFAYPNQAATSTLENHHPFSSDDAMGNNRMMSDDSESTIFLSNDSNAGALFDGLEVQLFGPVPPYLTHDHQQQQQQQPSMYVPKHEEESMDLGTEGMVNGGPGGGTAAAGFPAHGRAATESEEALDDIFGVDEWERRFTG
jgi:hypothetical protein